MAVWVGRGQMWQSKPINVGGRRMVYVMPLSSMSTAEEQKGAINCCFLFSLGSLSLKVPALKFNWIFQGAALTLDDSPIISDQFCKGSCKRQWWINVWTHAGEGGLWLCVLTISFKDPSNAANCLIWLHGQELHLQCFPLTASSIHL